MAFVRIENLVINTDYIAAVVFDDCPGVDRVCLVMAVLQIPQILQREGVQLDSERDFCLEFTGESARSLRDCFSSFNHVMDLRFHTPPTFTWQLDRAWSSADALVER